MKTRAIALFLTGSLAAGCSGNARLLPAMPASVPAAIASDTSGAVETLVRMRIPRRTQRRGDVHPSTISPMTQSVSIAVNAAPTQVFNATPSSPGCAAGSKGTTCTFAVHAQAGTDTFAVTTYSGVNATGTALDRGVVANVPIAKGKANNVAVSLGPVVTTTADSGPGSLRYAIASANSGDAVMFLLAKGATITLNGVIIVQNTVTVAGPGSAYLTISGGGSHQIFENVGALTISGLTLTHGIATVVDQPGGAILNFGSLTLSNDVIGSSTSTVSLRRVHRKVRALRMRGLHPHCTTTPSEGGAVYNGGAMTSTHTIYTNNVVNSDVASCIEGAGGAIFNDVPATLSSTDDTFIGNAALLGGAVYNASITAATFTGDTFNGNAGCTATNGCATSGCSATLCTSFAVGQGAAIYDAGFGITVAGSAFTSNVAGGKTPGSQGLGGALYLDSSLPSVTSSTFTGNLAGGGTASCSGGSGGAIFALVPLVADSDTFKNNAATGDNTSAGGAIYAATAVEGNGDTFSGNTATGSGGNCTASATAAGGAVLSGATATFTNSTFSGNSVSANAVGVGGGIAALAVTIGGCTFTGNAAVGTGAASAVSATGGGGALLLGDLSKVSGSTFASNTATAQSAVATQATGGAIASAATLESNDDTFASNASILKNNTANSSGGGAVSLASGTFISTADKFTANKATSSGTASGGAVLATGGVIMNDATVASNSASGPVSSEGGGLSVGTSGALKHVTVTGNSASSTTLGEGGGLFDAGGVTISESTIGQNSASTIGGGIFSETNPELLVNSAVTGNVVTAGKIPGSGGGGILIAAGLTMTQTTVSNNSVTLSGAGGGGGAILNAGNLTILASTISGNKVLGSAANGGGGGIISGGALTALDSTISNNSSSMDAGGVENGAGSGVTFSNVTMFENAAAGKGGNLYNYTGAAMALTNSVVGGGRAATGADVDNAGSITSGDYNIIQTAPAGAALTGTTTHDVIADPKLLPLSNNGGPTFTNADQLTSPGRAHIPYAASMCASVGIGQDQRGFTLGSGGRCDSGAYEYAGIATAIVVRPLTRPAIHPKPYAFDRPLPHLSVPKIPSSI